MVKEICSDAGISGHKTNHSLRAAGATGLYQAGVPEKVIQERTGHLSLTGMRQYEHTDDHQQQAVSRILASRERTTYQQQLADGARDAAPVQPMTVPQFSFHGCQVTIHSGPPTILPQQPRVEVSVEMTKVQDTLSGDL